MDQQPAPTPPALVLEGDLDVFSIHQQWEKVATLLATTSTRAEVDLSAIGDLDLSGLQLLCTLERDLKSKGVPLAVVGAQAEWKTRFTMLGLGGLFNGDAS